jgi:hypothetical protein
VFRRPEPGSIEYQRRTGGSPVLEPYELPRRAGMQEYIMVCGLGGPKTIWIRWYGRSAGDARASFRAWLGEPWQTLSTDFGGATMEYGFDFKPNSIQWFNIAG